MGGALAHLEIASKEQPADTLLNQVQLPIRRAAIGGRGAAAQPSAWHLQA